MTGEERRRIIPLAMRAALASVAMATALLLLKGYGAWHTGSVAMLGSLADTVLDLLAASAAAIAWRAIVALRNPEPTHDAGLGITVSVLAIAATLVLLWYQRHIIRRTGSIAIMADNLHYQSDALLNGSVIIALVLDQVVGWSWADPVLGIVIALWLAWGAFQASSQAIDQLMDKEWSEDQRAAYIEVAARSPGILGIHDFRTRRSGSHDFAQFHMEVAADLTVAAAHEIVVNVEQRLRDAFPKVEVLIHLDPEGYVDTDNPLIEADVTPHWFGKRI